MNDLISRADAIAKLLPCPFCGYKARVCHDKSSDYERHWTYYVWCLNDDCSCERGHYKTEAEAARAWNTRAQPMPAPDMSGVIEKLEIMRDNYIPVSNDFGDGTVNGINRAIELLRASTSAAGEQRLAGFSVDYRVSQMPHGEFVREVYYLTHDVIKHLGATITNEQFIAAETSLRDYVWKACQRAASSPTQEPGTATAGDVAKPVSLAAMRADVLDAMYPSILRKTAPYLPHDIYAADLVAKAVLDAAGVPYVD